MSKPKSVVGLRASVGYNRPRWRLVSTVAIGCEPGQARKGAAVATDSGAVIRFTVAAFFFRGLLASPSSRLFFSRLACKSELKALLFIRELLAAPN